MSDVREELQDLASGEGVYNIPGWMNNSSEVFDLFLSRNIVIPKPTGLVVTEERVGNEAFSYGAQFVNGEEYSANNDVEFWRRKVERDRESLEGRAKDLAHAEAVLDFLEAKGASEDKGNAALDKRRDDLAREFVNDGAYAYRFAEEPLKLAVDRIIDLEEAAK